jgi:hypothetical protein
LFTRIFAVSMVEKKLEENFMTSACGRMSQIRKRAKIQCGAFIKKKEETETTSVYSTPTQIVLCCS